MGLRDIGAALPPGFRFYPSDEELVCHYLYKKIANVEEQHDAFKATTDLMEIDLHTCEPWQLPGIYASFFFFFFFVFYLFIICFLLLISFLSNGCSHTFIISLYVFK